MNVKRLLVAVAAFLVIGLLPGPAAADYKPEFSLSLVINQESVWGRAAGRFADVLRHRTQGRIKIKNYFDGQLFKASRRRSFSSCNRESPTLPWGRRSTGQARSRS